MSSSEHEVDISVVSSPEPSPMGCGPDGRDTPLRSTSPARSHGASTPNSNHTPTTAAGTPTSSTSNYHHHHSPTMSAVPPTVLHHHLQHHLNSLNAGHPVALHHALHSFGHHLTHPAHQHLLHPGVVTPTAVQQHFTNALNSERLSPPAMASMAPKSPESTTTEESQTNNNNNNNSKVSNNNCSDSNTAGGQQQATAALNGNINNKVTSANGFTSFSISSILSRNEPKKNGSQLITPIAQLPSAGVGAGGPQDAAMLSR